MNGVYGLPNKVMASISTQLFKHEHLSKMLYYTSKEYTTQDIIAQKKVSWSKLKNKNIFIGRRVPIVLNISGAFISFRVFDYYPHNQADLYNVEVEIDVIVHKDCMDTIHGTRDIAIVTMIHEALYQKDLEGIGKCDILSTYDIRDLTAEYSGYTIRLRAKGINKGLWND